MDILEYHQQVNYLKKACMEYYKSRPFMSDAEYDGRYKHILQYEKDHPNDISKDSPTQKIHAPKGKIKHLKKMMSLESVDTFEELQDWVRKRKLLPDTKYCVDLKLDGMALEIVYKNHQLFSLSTRGKDGEYGENITHNKYMFINIPDRLETTDQTFAIYGEAELDIDMFKEIYQLENGKNCDNARNKVASILRSKVKNPNYEKKVIFMGYDYYPRFKKLDSYQLTQGLIDIIIPITNIDYRRQRMGPMEGIDFINYFYQEIYRLRKDNDLSIEIDGIVIKVNDGNIQDKLGYGAKSPNFMIAWKFPPITIKTCLTDVKWDVGSTGLVTPTGVLDPPCEFGTVIVTKVNLHSVKNIRDKRLMINSEVDVARLKDVIPGIVGVESVYENEYPIFIPTHCPSCNEPLEVQKVHLKCNNLSCRTKLIKKISLELSEYKIMGIGEKIVEKLFDILPVKDTKAVISLSLDKLQNILGNKVGTKLYDQFQDLFKKGYM